jgi:hypothetical protein
MLKLILGAVFLVVLGKFRVTGTLYGQPFSCSILVMVFAAVLAATLLATALVIRAIIREARPAYA